MGLLKRFGYYLIGLSLGSVLVLFIWKGKNVAFPYGPDARTLSSIRKKQLIYAEDVKGMMSKIQIDTSEIQKLLTQGDVDFGKSKPRLTPCAEYLISGIHAKKTINMYVKRCDSTALIERMWLED